MSKGLKNQFESATINELSVFESLTFTVLSKNFHYVTNHNLKKE